MSDAGNALLGIGMGQGEERAVEAAEAAVSSPLLETSMEGARSILLSITGGHDLSLWEVNEAAKAVAEAAHPDANIIFGAMVDEKLEEQVWVTVVATGYQDGDRPRRRRPRGAGGRAARRSAARPSARGASASTSSTSRSSCRAADAGPGGPSRAGSTILTGVPTGMMRARRTMSRLRMRMQPCDTRPGTRSGRSVPWMPMKPPAGQSVSVGDVALVPKATGPYVGLA